jgi:hypothetical protein
MVAFYYGLSMNRRMRNAELEPATKSHKAWRFCGESSSVRMVGLFTRYLSWQSVFVVYDHVQTYVSSFSIF